MSNTIVDKLEFDASSIEVERASPEDAETICDIRDRAWLEAYPNDSFGITAEDIRLNAQGRNGEFVPRRVKYLQELLADGGELDLTILVAKVGGEVKGYIDARTEEGRCTISAIYVDPEAQGSGVGGRLLQYALELLGCDQDIFLDVVSYNHNAIGFYKRFGFEKTDAVVPKDDEAPEYVKQLPNIEMVLKAKTT